MQALERGVVFDDLAMASQDELTQVSSGRHRSTTRSLGKDTLILVRSVNSCIAGPGMPKYTRCRHATIGVTNYAGKPLCHELPKIFQLIVSVPNTSTGLC